MLEEKKKKKPSDVFFNLQKLHETFNYPTAKKVEEDNRESASFTARC